MLKKIVEKIKEYQKIVIVRHVQPDGDCVCGSLALREMITKSFKDKVCKIYANDYIEHLKHLGSEDLDEEKDFYKNCLVICIDTSNKNRISNKYVSEFEEIIKLDHHLETDPYGDINFVDENASSACELIVDLYLENKETLVMDKSIATKIYTGMILDNGRFRYSQTSKETFQRASILLDFDIDLEYIYTNIYTKDFKIFNFQAKMMSKIKNYQDVLYLKVPLKLQKKYNLTHSEASNCVGLMEGIKNCLIYILFVENEDKTYRIRIRSRFVEINRLAEKFNGGGHKFACGARIKSSKEIKGVLEESSKVLNEFKKNTYGVDMRILITNDDSINALGLQILVEASLKYGEVIVVSPKTEQSAKSHSINLLKDLEIEKVNKFKGVTSYALDSTPADCVRYFLHGLNEKCDIVFSGINHGFNTGFDINYSGTCSCIFEAGLNSIKGVAFSSGLSFKSAKKNIQKVIDFIFNNNLFSHNLLYNVNFPDEGDLIKITKQGKLTYNTHFTSKDSTVFQTGSRYYEDKLTDVDTYCVQNNYISITPLKVERDCLETFEKIKHIN